MKAESLNPVVLWPLTVLYAMVCLVAALLAVASVETGRPGVALVVLAVSLAGYWFGFTVQRRNIAEATPTWKPRPLEIAGAGLGSAVGLWIARNAVVGVVAWVVIVALMSSLVAMGVGELRYASRVRKNSGR